MFAAEQPAAESGPVRKLSDVRVDFSAVFDALPTAYLVLTLELHIADANMAYQRLVGLSAADMVGRPVFDVFPPTPASLSADGTNTVRASIERARDTGRIDVMPLVNYDILNPATGHVEERHWAHDQRACARPDGATQLILQRVEDVTEFVRERAGLQAERDRGSEWRVRVEAFEAQMYAMAQELRLAHEARNVVGTRLHSVSSLALQRAAAETVEELERIVVGQGLRILGADGGAIISPDGEGNWRATLSEALGKQVLDAYASEWGVRDAGCGQSGLVHDRGPTGKRLVPIQPERCASTTIATMVRQSGPQRTRRILRVEETSAGGLVLDRFSSDARGALIGRLDRRGRLLWSLPKGHLESGESFEQAASREVAEETGITGTVIGALGTIDFWFVAAGSRIHKTVHHFLLVATGGELSDADVEVHEVAWVPLADIAGKLFYPDERALVDKVPAVLLDSA